ncbi:MAG TPA: ATP-binding cassette domain-containing protein [Xanthomonadaceae bacterium]|nr:ATP-binding cassette domain-containing protein [Xanthomonadaceae bacterium]
MIKLRNLALRRGGRLLLSGVELTLHEGWRVGVVGRNGSGKSSLFAALLGRLEADAGDVELPARTRIAAVAQETPALPESALDFVLAGDTALAAALVEEGRAAAAGDHEAAARAHQRIDELGGYDARARAGRLLHGLGFAPDTYDTLVAGFSGGWRMRLNLARVLMAPSDLLLLDEPTNHLDLDAVLWLEDWLRRYAGTVLLISHDREFLDGVVDHVLHLHEGSARLYAGDYTQFERQRAEHLRQQRIAFDREQAERERLQRFVDRFRAKATKARQAQSRLKRIQKLAGTEAVRAERGFEFAFAAPGKLPIPLLRFDGVDAGYPGNQDAEDETVGAAHGRDRSAEGPPPCRSRAGPTPAEAARATVILRGVRLSLEPGDRIGLLGRNGAGKSTLVRTLAGSLAPLAGERLAHQDLCIGYFAQHTVDTLRAGESPFDHLRALEPALSEQVARDFLGRWNFAGERVFEPVEGFSGGERARLALALIAWARPNLVLLDEPTNHLDLDMREALAEALIEFDGAVVLVSHDRHLLGLTCERYWRVADGTVAAFDGDLDDYASWLRSREGAAGTRPLPPAPVEVTTARDRRRAAAGARDRQRPLRQRLREVERELEALRTQVVSIQAELADPALYTREPERAARLGRTQGELLSRVASFEDEWLELAGALEDA